MTGAEMKAEAQRWRRGDLFAVLAALVLGTVLAVIVINIQSLRHDLQTSNEARDALAAQVQGLGATPIAGDPGSRGEVGPSGPPGPAGRDGTMPSPGPTGPRGVPGTPGANSTVPGPTGAAGRPGANSTIPGPTGAPGRNGVDGRNGADGSDGSDGDDGADGAAGADGADGNPPTSWTYTDFKGDQHVCSRVADFDPDDPRYTCAPVAG